MWHRDAYICNQLGHYWLRWWLEPKANWHIADKEPNFTENWINIRLFSIHKMHSEIPSTQRLNFVQVSTAPSYYFNQCWNIVNWIHRNQLEWNFNKIHTFSLKKMQLKISYEKMRPFCFGLNVLLLDAVTYPVGLSCYMTIVMVGHGDRVIGFRCQCRYSLGLRLNTDPPCILGYMCWRDGPIDNFVCCLFSRHSSQFKYSVSRESRIAS